MIIDVQKDDVLNCGPVGIEASVCVSVEGEQCGMEHQADALTVDQLPQKATMDLLTQTTWALFPHPNNDCTRVNGSGSSTQWVQPFSPCRCFVPEQTPEKHVPEFPSKLSR